MFKKIKTTFPLMMLALLVMAGFSASAHAQHADSFTLTCNVEGLPEGMVITLLSKEGRAVDSAASVGGNIKLTGTVNGANGYFLTLGKAMGNASSNILWLTAGEQQIQTKLADWKNLQPAGSAAHREYLAVEQLLHKGSSQEEKEGVWKSFLVANPNSLYAPFLIQQLDRNEWERQYAALGASAKQSGAGKQIAAYLTVKNGHVPDVHLTMPNGQTTSLLAEAAKAKYTLIDFWASWCAWCRAEIPKLKTTYNAFRAKGFNVIGISTDLDEQAWQKAVAEDNTTWLQGLDNVDFASRYAFAIEALPRYLLIDSKGKIVRSGLTMHDGLAISDNVRPDGSLRGNLTEVLENLLLPPKNWHLLDQQEDEVYGVSVEKAYRELLTGCQGDTVLLAVIDSGVDTLHSDLVPTLWKNPKEKANGRDDDINGYADDRWGWSYIGGATGNVHHDNTELVRELKVLNPRFEGHTPATLSRRERQAYQRYRQLEKEFKESMAPFQNQRSLFSLVMSALDSVVMLIGKENPTLADFKAFEPQSINQNYAKVKAVEGMVDGRDFATYRREAYEEPLAKVELKLNSHFNLDFDPRSIVGDNYVNKTERHYGNADVQGPDPTHGTHVSGIIGAVRQNGIGMDGVADKVKLLTVRAIPDGDERDKDVANAIRYAVDNGAKVINMSFGKAHSPDRKIVEKAIRYAGKKDVLIVNAAGNEGKSIDHRPNFPASRYGRKDRKRFKHMITVGASGATRENIVAPFSNYGKENVDVFAPGVQIYSTVPGNGYAKLDGTSMAAPVVSGIAAVLRSYFPELSAREVKELIEAGVTKIEGPIKRPGKLDVEMTELCRTGGIVNAYNSIKLALEKGK